MVGQLGMTVVNDLEMHVLPLLLPCNTPAHFNVALAVSDTSALALEPTRPCSCMTACHLTGTFVGSDNASDKL